GGIAEEGGGALDPGATGVNGVERPFLPAEGRVEELADRGCPAGETLREPDAIAGRRPALLVPGFLDDGDDIDRRTAGDRVVHQMRVLAEPKADAIGGDRGGRIIEGDDGAPGGAAARPRPVGAGKPA